MAIALVSGCVVTLMGCPGPTPEPTDTDLDDVEVPDTSTSDADDTSDTDDAIDAAPDTAAPDTTPDTGPPAWDLAFVTWNLESGDAQLDQLLTLFDAYNTVPLWGLTEVDFDDAFVIREAISDGDGDYYFVAGESGDYAEDDDRLVVLFDTLRFELIATCELWSVIQDNDNSQRAPLVAHLRDTTHDEELLFMVNHLQRDTWVRMDQAERLRDWVAGDLVDPDCSLNPRTTPLVAVGDYNLDLDVRDDPDGNRWLNTLREALTWVVPDPLVRSHCTWREMLFDYVFVASVPDSWVVASRVYTDETQAVCGWPQDRSSDHRPVMGWIAY